MTGKKFSATELSGNISIYHALAIRISNRIIEYSIFDSVNKKIEVLESWNIGDDDDPFALTNTLEKIKNDSILLNNDYGKVVIIPDTPIYTIIPEKLFIETDSKKYLEFNHIIHTNKKVCVDNVEKIAGKIIYGFSYEIDCIATKMFQNFQYKHTSTILIETILSLRESDVAFIHINGNCLDILVKKNDVLKFCNSFIYNSPEDIIYYILNVFKQSDINPANIPLLLAGDVERESAIFTIIYKYVKNVSFHKRPESFSYCRGIQELPEQMYFCLFKSFLCE